MCHVRAPPRWSHPRLVRRSWIDAPITGEARVRDDIAQPALPRDLDCRDPANRLFVAAGDIDQPQLPTLFSDQRHLR